MMKLFTEGGMWLKFEGGPHKWYAKTPLGEYAYGEYQGLYEWTRLDEDGKPSLFGNFSRISYSGGDHQASDSKGRRTIHSRPEPNERGLEYAINQYNYGVN